MQASTGQWNGPFGNGSSRRNSRNLDAELMKLKDRGNRRWYVNSQGQTFAVIEGPVEFRMGSPPEEADRFTGEILHQREHSPPVRHRRQGSDGRAVPGSL